MQYNNVVACLFTLLQKANLQNHITKRSHKVYMKSINRFEDIKHEQRTCDCDVWGLLVDGFRVGRMTFSFRGQLVRLRYFYKCVQLFH